MKSCKLHLVLTFLTVLSVILTACGQAVTPTATVAPVVNTEIPNAVPTTVPTEAPVTLTIYHNYGSDDAKGAPMQQIFAGFMAEYPYITLDTQVYVDSDIPGKVETEFVAGKEPDLVFTNFNPLVNNWIDEGLATPIAPLMTQFGFDGRFSAKAISNWTNVKGQLLAFPFEGYVQPVLYNMNILNAAGVSIPTTTDELLADVPKIKAAGYEVFAASPDDDGGSISFRFFWQGALTPDEVRTVVQKGHLASYPDGVAGMEDFFRLKNAGAYAADVSGTPAELEHTMFYTGKAAMWTGGSWYWQEMINQAPDLVPNIKLAGFPIPHGSTYTKPVMRSAFTAKGVVITANGAKKMDAVEKFIKYLYRPENIALFVEQAGMIPPITDLKVDPSKLAPIFQQGIALLNSDTVTVLPVTTLPSGVEYDAAESYAYTAGATAEQTIAILDKAFTDVGIP
ncbi:MAG: extracellular solute-binding protein [Anaerolineales bacterium]|jgi:multiple sugar transport system substrate-binding protein